MVRKPWMLMFLAASILFPANAKAMPIKPGQTTIVPTTPLNSTTTATILGGLSGQGSVGNGQNAVSFSVQELVLQEGKDLDFCFQLVVAPSSNGKLSSFTLSGFALPVTTDIYQVASLPTKNGNTPGLNNPNSLTNTLGTGTVQFKSAVRSSMNADNGNVLTFNFSNTAPLTAKNNTSYVAIIRTNADAMYKPISGTLQAVNSAGNTSGNVTILVPPRPPAEEPEPTSLVLFGGAFAGLAVGFRLRRAVSVV